MSNLPKLNKHQSFCCSNGCGECKTVKTNFEYSRTENFDGQLIDLKTEEHWVSSCCKVDLLIWDEQAQDSYTYRDFLIQQSNKEKDSNDNDIDQLDDKALARNFISIAIKRMVEICTNKIPTDPVNLQEQAIQFVALISEYHHEIFQQGKSINSDTAEDIRAQLYQTITHMSELSVNREPDRKNEVKHDAAVKIKIKRMALLLTLPLCFLESFFMDASYAFSQFKFAWKSKRSRKQVILNFKKTWIQVGFHREA